MLVIQRPTVEPLGEDEGNRQRFAVSPLEPGFGHTLGNSLRRTLLSSIPGAAVTQVRFDDALHEFDTIAGVTEDVTDIILNLKDLVLRVEADEPVTLRLDVRGPADVTAGDIQTTADVEILNPDLHIATLNAKGRLAIDITVERGRGYVSADRNKQLDTIGVIPVDSIFSPVRRVDVHGRAHPRRAVDRTTTASSSTSRPTARSRPARRWPRPATRCARSSHLVADMSDEPQGLELGEVSGADAGSPDLDLPDRGPRPVRASPQLPQAGPDQHHRRAAREDRGRPAGHHQLRAEVARRGHAEARRARPVACAAED